MRDEIETCVQAVVANEPVTDDDPTEGEDDRAAVLELLPAVAPLETATEDADEGFICDELAEAMAELPEALDDGEPLNPVEVLPGLFDEPLLDGATMTVDVYGPE